MDRERRLRAAKEVAAFHQAAAAAAASEARPRTSNDAPSPTRSTGAAVTAVTAPAAITAAQPLTLAVAAAAALRRRMPAEPAAPPVPAGSSGATASAPSAPRYRPARSITTAPSLEELYQDVNATPAPATGHVMLPGKQGSLVKVLSSKDEEKRALQAAANEAPDPPPALVNAESATAACVGAGRTISKILDALELPTLGGAQGSNTGTVLDAAAAAAAATGGAAAEAGEASAAETPVARTAAAASAAASGAGSGGSGEQNAAGPREAPAERPAFSLAIESRGDGVSVLPDARRSGSLPKKLKRARSI